MSFNLRDIRQAPHTKPKKHPPQRPRDALPDAGLAHPRGADETDDFTLNGSAEFTDGEELEDTVFDVAQAVVVFVEDCARVGYGVVFGGVLAPWNLPRGLVC
jgi:hypothetical protein